jgi:large subunit ribosomal protein L43
MRTYLGNGKLVSWATAHPHVEIEVQVRNGHHPFVLAEYRSMAATHQISVRNVDRWQDVQDVLYLLSNRSGRKITKITTPVLTDTPSIQGVWTPFLTLKDLPPFAVQIHEP